MWIAGIDEAGLGPVLGPLVVSAAAMSVPDELAGQSLWDLLAPAVCRKPSRRLAQVAIGDSKKLYSRKSKAGLTHLERAVLGMLAAERRTATSLDDLLAVVAPDAAASMARYPWYAGSSLALPQRISATDVAFAGNSLAAALERRGITLATIRCEAVLVEEFNRIVQAARNKSTAAFDVTCRLLAYLRRKFTGRLQVHVDRQGGRKRYLPALERIFPDARMKILDEGDSSSGYSLIADGSRMDVFFTVGAEQQHLPVALASMVSKYLRELFMTLFNRFWQEKVRDVAPTAGYYTDGRRFFEEIQPAMRQMAVETHLVYRCR